MFLAIILLKTAVSQSCFTQHTATEYWQVLTSPQYPIPFDGSTRCIWRVEAPQGYQVVLEFSDFLLLEQDTQCPRQSLSIMNIDGPGVGIYCGNAKPEPLVSKTRGFNLQLLSEQVEYNNDYRGFRLKYRIHGIKKRLPAAPPPAAFKKPKKAKTSKSQFKNWNFKPAPMQPVPVADRPKTCRPGYPCPEKGIIPELNPMNKNPFKKEKSQTSLGVVISVICLIGIAGFGGLFLWKQYEAKQKKQNADSNLTRLETQMTNLSGQDSGMSHFSSFPTVMNASYHHEVQHPTIERNFQMMQPNMQPQFH